MGDMLDSSTAETGTNRTDCWESSAPHAESSQNEPEVLSLKVAQQILAVLAWFTLPLTLLMGVPGTVASAAVFYRQGLRERINLCLFALAIADLMNDVDLFLVYGENRVREHFNPNAWLTIPYFAGASGIEWASLFLSAVIASERCFCVVSPFHAKRLLKTSTMAAIIVVCCFLLVGGMFAIAGPKHAVDFIFDPSSNTTRSFVTVTKYYLDNKNIIDILDIIIYTTALPITFFIIIIISTSITAIKLKAALKQRNAMTKATHVAESPSKP